MEMVLKKYFLIFFAESSYTFDDFKVMGSLFQILGAATEKVHLPRLCFALGTKSC